MEDIEIIDLYWNRNETAIKETDNKYGRFCHSLAMNILSVWEDAEECVSDTYQKAWNAIPPERPNAFRAWLGRIVRNLSINCWHQNRAQKRYNGMEELLAELADSIPDTNTTEGILEAQELSAHINDWLSTLTAGDRALFLRRYWNGEQLQYLAELSGITPNKLAGHMFRLRKSLQKYLTKKGVTL